MIKAGQLYRHPLSDKPFVILSVDEGAGTVTHTRSEDVGSSTRPRKGFEAAIKTGYYAFIGVASETRLDINGEVFQLKFGDDLDAALGALQLVRTPGCVTLGELAGYWSATPCK